ncbi:hypothetical protein [Paenibacillus thermotolerans]|uniref:hypothetical protein n=1 Tax=Paenibacillus thermotolerans TaxID=3027807 RepID=UPI002368E31B|nr:MULTISPECIES: hypothetical protein [unclassified Paenibacillus]
MNDWFFHYHPFSDLSSAMLLHADLTMPVLQEIATSISKQLISRGQEEAVQIRKEQNPVRLLRYLNKETDSMNHLLLLKRLLEYENQVTPALLGCGKLKMMC